MNSGEKETIRQHVSGSSALNENTVASSFANVNNEEALTKIACEHWENASTSPVDLRHVLQRLLAVIGIVPHIAAKSRTARILQVYYRATAMLVIPLLITSLYLLFGPGYSRDVFATITAPRGSRVQFTLPDGSSGFLNSGSTLQYPSSFSKKRSVVLTGQGYFEVVSDKKHPFTVETPHASVRALGTRFDICAYPEEQEIITTLEEGNVLIINKETSAQTRLQPGEQNRFDITGNTMNTLEVRTQLYTSWKEEMLRFDNAPLTEVVKKMERWYGVKIILDKDLKYSDNYTLTIKTESLREMMQLLALTTPMNYTIDEDSVFIFHHVKSQPMKY